MKKASTRKTKSRTTSTKKNRSLRRLGGSQNEQNWLQIFAMLILATVLIACFVAYMKSDNMLGRHDRHMNSKYDKDKKVKANNQAREDRIRAVYDMIGLDGSFVVQEEEIFGDKRTYEWDKDRSYASSRKYLREADVKDTVEVAKAAIEKAGFGLINEEYAGSVDAQYHFQGDRGEFVRLSVISKNVTDLIDGISKEDSLTDEERWAAPSVVTIKVNLDDNNE